MLSILVFLWAKKVFVWLKVYDLVIALHLGDRIV